MKFLASHGHEQHVRAEPGDVAPRSRRVAVYIDDHARGDREDTPRNHRLVSNLLVAQASLQDGTKLDK
jgi:hypothetical protein